MTSRKNAMLTTEDRRWLAGEKAYEGEHAKQQRYQRRRDIRERVYNTLLDFSILFEHLEADERRKLFGEPGARQEPLTEDRELVAGVRDAIAFLLYSTGVARAMDDGADRETIAEQLLTDALYQVGQEDGLLVRDVDLRIDADALSRPALLAALEAGEELSPEELRALLETDAVDTRAVQECIRATLAERTDATSNEVEDQRANGSGGTTPDQDGGSGR